MKATSYQIREEANVIDDHLLDIIGATFNFDHVKGLAEWLKNSVDAYRRTKTADGDQQVIFRFADGDAKSAATIECIDFVGMDGEDIEKALKRWGDPEASKRGIRNLKTYGGHGNGGKFYMRQMFETSQYITYKNGKLNIFGFSQNKKYGFADGYKDKSVSPADALSIAGLDVDYIPQSLRSAIMHGKTGFTVVQGVGPSTMPKVVKVGYICKHLVSHPQAQRILSHVPAAVVYGGSVMYQRLTPERLNPLPGFGDIAPVPVPKQLLYQTAHERIEVEMANAKFPQGVLQLRTSEIAMERGGTLGELNRLDFIGELGVIASYKMNELGTAGYMPQASFIYGECECPILEDPEEDSVTNDRSKLIENPRTKALLAWADEQVHALCLKIAEKQKVDREQDMKDVSSSLNNFLNQWKDKYMSQILAEVLTSPGEGPGVGPVEGGTGPGFPPPTPGVERPIGPPPIDTPPPSDEDKEGGGGTTKRAKRSPRVLLSDQDPDPFDPDGHSITLSDRQPAVYQRPQDVDEGLYWINTSAPLAKSILDRYKQDSIRWRDYLFQRYVDIFVKEALLKLEKRDPSDFNAFNVEQTIGEVVQRIHEAASKELREFLFEETFEPVT